ncbi:MAG: hypothetical protein M9893_04580 [Pyrinomonadaceae bacterium]|nr:hypothetical protein [Pyrinomonadaceae bacterium]
MVATLTARPSGIVTRISIRFFASAGATATATALREVVIDNSLGNGYG